MKKVIFLTLVLIAACSDVEENVSKVKLTADEIDCRQISGLTDKDGKCRLHTTEEIRDACDNKSSLVIDGEIICVDKSQIK